MAAAGTAAAGARHPIQIVMPGYGEDAAGETEGQRLMRRMGSVKREYDTWVPSWQECYDYFMPNRMPFTTETTGVRRTQDIYDETGIVYAQEFASMIKSIMMPDFMRWLNFKAGRGVPKNQVAEVNMALQEVCEYTFDVINNSNFSSQCTEALLEMAIGTGVMLGQPGGPSDLMTWRALPMNSIMLESGPWGEIDGFYRPFKIQAGLIGVEYPNAMITQEEAETIRQNPGEQIELVEIVFRDWSFPTQHVYQWRLVWKSYADVIDDRTLRGMGSNPFSAFRWSTTAGESYGRGPIFNCLSAAKTTNLAMEMTLQNAEMAIVGMYQYDNDGTINPDTIDLVPGVLIPRSPMGNGLDRLDSAANFDLSQFVFSEMRENIKRALYVNDLGPTDKTPMSAMEVAARQQDLSRRIGASFGRLYRELVVSTVRRATYILNEQGRISMPILDGNLVSTMPISPLAKAQMQEDVNSFDQYVGLLQARFGPEVANMVIKAPESAEWLSGKFNIPAKLIRTEPERRQLAANMAQMAQLAAPAGQAPQRPPMATAA